MAKRGPKGASKYTDYFIDKLADKLLKWIEEPTNFWIGKFASDNKLWRQRLDEFANKRDKFSDALKIAKQIQEDRIVLLAMGKKIDNAMAIFALKNVAGWRDKTEIEGKGLEPKKIIVNIINTGKVIDAHGGNGNGKRHIESSRQPGIPGKL